MLQKVRDALRRYAAKDPACAAMGPPYAASDPGFATEICYNRFGIRCKRFGVTCKNTEVWVRDAVEELPNILASLTGQSKDLMRVMDSSAVRHILILDHNTVVIQDQVALEPRDSLQISDRLLHNVLRSLWSSFSRGSWHFLRIYLTHPQVQRQMPTSHLGMIQRPYSYFPLRLPVVPRSLAHTNK